MRSLAATRNWSRGSMAAGGFEDVDAEEEVGLAVEEGAGGEGICDLRVAICDLGRKGTGRHLRFAVCDLRLGRKGDGKAFANCELRFAIGELRVAICPSVAWSLMKVIWEKTPPLRMAIAFLVGEDDAVALFVAGTDEDGADDADAHAADAGHVSPPGVAGVVHGVEQVGSGSLSRAMWGRVYRRRRWRNDGDLLEAGAGLDAGAGFVTDLDALAGAVVDAPGEVGVDFAAVVGFDGGQAGAGGPGGCIRGRLRRPSGVTFMWVFLGR